MHHSSMQSFRWPSNTNLHSVPQVMFEQLMAALQGWCLMDGWTPMTVWMHPSWKRMSEMQIHRQKSEHQKPEHQRSGHSWRRTVTEKRRRIVTGSVTQRNGCWWSAGWMPSWTGTGLWRSHLHRLLGCARWRQRMSSGLRTSPCSLAGSKVLSIGLVKWLKGSAPPCALHWQRL